jgi:hypothetical protein
VRGRPAFLDQGSPHFGWDRADRRAICDLLGPAKIAVFFELRRRIGSIIASAYHQPAIDEVQLTRWMHAHLRVIAIPVANPDSLDDLETEILAELDPPLNLAKVAKTPLRLRLSALPKQYAAKSPTDSP